MLSRDHSVSSKTAMVVGVTPQQGQPVCLGGEDQPRTALHTPHACAQGHSESKGPRGAFDPVQPGAVAQAMLCGDPKQILGQFPPEGLGWRGWGDGPPAWALGSPSHLMTMEGSRPAAPGGCPVSAAAREDGGHLDPGRGTR